MSKRRVPLALAPCRGERVALLIAGERWESVAIEGDDPDEVLAAIRRLGFEGIPNTNYPGMLKNLITAPGQVPTPTQEKT